MHRPKCNLGTHRLSSDNVLAFYKLLVKRLLVKQFSRRRRLLTQVNSTSKLLIGLTHGRGSLGPDICHARLLHKHGFNPL